MALKDPIAIFTASSNIRAHALCHVLEQSGIEAHVAEDYSLVGLWVGGTIPGIHSPKVWVDRADAERAAAIIQQDELRQRELQSNPQAHGEVVQVQSLCDECGKVASFPAVQRGSVQECPHCGAYLDVVEDHDGDLSEQENDEAAGDAQED
jgi:hypothetical protein